jgi:hypothetical protein
MVWVPLHANPDQNPNISWPELSCLYLDSLNPDPDPGFLVSPDPGDKKKFKNVKLKTFHILSYNMDFQTIDDASSPLGNIQLFKTWNP